MSETFGTRVKVLRKKAGLTQFQLAEKLNIHERTVSKWERDLSEPDFGVYGLLAEALNVSIEELFGLPVPHERVEGKFDILAFGKTISTERKRLDESQEKLANIVGASSNTVSKWERGVVCPDKCTFLKLAEHFGLKPSEFYYSLRTKENIAYAVTNETNNRKKLILILTISAAIVLCATIITLVCILPFRDNNRLNPDLPPIIDTTKPQCEHNYVTQTIASTCVLQGYELHTCTECGDSFTSDYTPLAEHNYNGQTIASTCTLQGYELHTCTECGDSYKSDYTSFAEHKYTCQQISATCTSQGYELHTCTECGYNYKSDFIPLADHTMGEWIIDKNATCTQTGSKHMECSVCHTVLNTIQIEKEAHNYSEEFVPPVADGYGYKLFVCIECNYTYKDEFTLPAESQLLYKFDFEAKTCAVEGVGENAEPYIEIPSYIEDFKVISISLCAFEDCVTLREIVIPDTIIEIGKYAFHRCTMLQHVVLPDSIIELGDEAFCGCRSLESVVLPSKISRLKYSVFSDCVNLQNIIIPSGITIIEDLAFNNCQRLNEILLPESVTFIGLCAFNNCRSLTKIAIPKNVWYIGDNAFGNCLVLTEVEFDNPFGWTAGNAPLSGNNLSDPVIAANYLTNVYNLDIWIKE